MVDYVEAIKRPFTDIGKLVLGIILGIIPIVQFIVWGYFLDVAKTAMNKDMKMPDFKDFGKMFVNGLLAFIIALIYALPVIVLMLIPVMTGAFSISTIVNKITSGEGMYSIIAALGSLGAYFFVIVIIGIILAFIGSVAILRFAETREFGTAFEFGEIAKKAFTKTYIIGYIISVVIGLVISSLIGLIPIVGGAIASFISGVIVYTALGQAYSEA